MNSPERGSLITAGEEENNPIIVAGIRHSYYQCKNAPEFHQYCNPDHILDLTNHPNTPTP
jgi:hypothetical protein